MQKLSRSIFVICLTLLTVACDRYNPESVSQSEAEQAHEDDPFRPIKKNKRSSEIMPKESWMFPVGTINSLSQYWYSGHLQAAGESKIYPNIEKVHYRFTWLRSYHHPFIFHIRENETDGFTLTISKLSGNGGYGPGEIATKHSIDLPAAKVTELRELLNGIGFWGLPSEEVNGGLHGARWIMESVDKGKYHVVDRMSAGALKSVGRWFMDTGKIDVPEEDIY